MSLLLWPFCGLLCSLLGDENEMRDIEGNSIRLAHEANGHLLVWGRSGEGKTYFCQRKIEEYLEDGKRILILDFSGSYTKEQLEKNNFKYIEDVAEFSPYKNPFFLMARFDNFENFSEHLSHALLPLLGVSGHFQKKLLRRSIKKHFEHHTDWNPAEYTETLEAMLQEFRKELDMVPRVTSREDYASIGKILSRFEPYSDIGHFHIRLLKGSLQNLERERQKMVYLHAG